MLCLFESHNSNFVGYVQESFDPIVDPISGRDLIPSLVYGRNTRNQDFGGVYCMVLTVESSVISAGLLRVLGCDVAELPLVATKRENQGLVSYNIPLQLFGMCVC
ncbi:increased DNA methylation 1-like, partial [Phalaenopsis equestris]|uniref:increased DNA methylation 1-like n=1 Tax=Phalaenopsis equestris TaxID=78828 RepID=UPI0009E4C2D2